MSITLALASPSAPGIALLLSELGLDVEMRVGSVLGLAIGAYLDKRSKVKMGIGKQE